MDSEAGTSAHGSGLSELQHDAKKDGILRMLKAVDGNESDVVVFGDA